MTQPNTGEQSVEWVKDLQVSLMQFLQKAGALKHDLSIELNIAYQSSLDTLSIDLTRTFKSPGSGADSQATTIRMWHHCSEVRRQIATSR